MEVNLSNIAFDFEISTINLIKEFNEYLKHSIKKHPDFSMSLARKYIQDGIKMDNISEEFYHDIDTLFDIRMKAIQNEKVHILAQAQKANIKIPKYVMNILSGKELAPFLEDEVYQNIPTLKIIEYMIFYTPIELAQIKHKFCTDDR